MTGAELALGLTRGTHIAAAMTIFGSMVFQTFVARSPPHGAADHAIPPVDRRIYRVISISLVLAFVTACIWLPLETASVTDDGTPGQIVAALPILLWDSLFGELLIARLGILIVACFIFRAGGSIRFRTIAVLLAALGVILQVGLGHGLSMEGSTGIILLLAEGIHLLSAAAWLGGLLALLIAVATLEPETALPSVVRFSHLGTVCVVLLAVTIVVQSWELIGGIAGFIGTDYGRIALIKSTLFLLLLALAALNRWRFTPRMSTASGALGRTLLSRSIAIETAVGLLAILSAGLLLTQSPAIHEQPSWPFASQFNAAALSDPDLGPEAWRGVEQAFAGLLLVAAACLLVLFRRPRIAGAAVALSLIPFWWSTAHLDLLFVPAYPTSFYQSPTGFTAASIVQGARLFPTHCVSCHGAEGRGNGDLAKTLSVPPADLTAEHLFAHSDGELFWWLTHGIEGADGNLVMPGFADQLDDDARWNLIDYIRAHNMGLAGKAAGTPPQPIPAPDMTVSFNNENIPLSKLRGRIICLVAMPKDGAKLPEIPRSGDIDVTNIPIMPKSDAWTAYAVMAGVLPDQLAGTAFVIDRFGWLRAVLRPRDEDGAPDLGQILAAARRAENNPIQVSNAGSAHHHH